METLGLICDIAGGLALIFSLLVWLRLRAADRQITVQVWRGGAVIAAF